MTFNRYNDPRRNIPLTAQEWVALGVAMGALALALAAFSISLVLMLGTGSGCGR